MGDDRANVYYDPLVESWVYRASSVGRSLRCLSAARQGYDPLPPPDYLVAAAEAGNRYELIAKTKLRSMGYTVAGEQGEIDYRVTDTALIRGHLDAAHCLVPDDDTGRILEVKSMSQRVFDKWLSYGFEKFPEYAAQVTSYMYAQAQRQGRDGYLEAVYAVINRETDEMDIRVLATPPTDIQTIVQRIALAEHFASIDKLPVCDSASQYTCPYNYLCDLREILFEEVEEGTEAMLRSLGDEYTEIKKLEATIKDRLDDVKREIAKALGKREEAKIPNYTFTYKEGSRRQLNQFRLREKLGDELDDYYEDSPTKRSVRVYPKKEE
jgi:hypothetical protein